DSSTVQNFLRKRRGICKIEPIFISGAAECAVSEADETARRNDGVNKPVEHLYHSGHLPDQASVRLIMRVCDCKPSINLVLIFRLRRPLRLLVPRLLDYITAVAVRIRFNSPRTVWTAWGPDGFWRL